MTKLSRLLDDVRACTLCSVHLPLEPKPILQLHSEAKILIAGQAPGRKAHDSGVPFDDASGRRLREWLGLSDDEFYDPQKVAILPMGFCFPGSGKSGDLAPRRECVSAWRYDLLDQLNDLKLTIVLGSFAQKHHFSSTYTSVTELVQSWRSYWPSKLPLPHPSPRNNLWLRKNPWFEAELLPELQLLIRQILNS